MAHSAELGRGAGGVTQLVLATRADCRPTHSAPSCAQGWEATSGAGQSGSLTVEMTDLDDDDDLEWRAGTADSVIPLVLGGMIWGIRGTGGRRQALEAPHDAPGH